MTGRRTPLVEICPGQGAPADAGWIAVGTPELQMSAARLHAAAGTLADRLCDLAPPPEDDRPRRVAHAFPVDAAGLVAVHAASSCGILAPLHPEWGGERLESALARLASDPPRVHDGAPTGVWAAADACLDFLARTNPVDP